MDNPRVIAIGTAMPTTSYTQAQLAQYFGVGNRKIQALFANSHIKKRCLNLPRLQEALQNGGAEGPMLSEDPDILASRHRQGVISLKKRIYYRCDHLFVNNVSGRAIFYTN